MNEQQKAIVLSRLHKQLSRQTESLVKYADRPIGKMIARDIAFTNNLIMAVEQGCTQETALDMISAHYTEKWDYI